MTLVKTVKISKLTFAPMRMSKRLKLQLPAWFHLDALDAVAHNPTSEGPQLSNVDIDAGVAVGTGRAS